MKIIQGVLRNPNANLAIAIARFNQFINNSLLNGALDVLKRIGEVKDDNITVVWVPGAYELPLVVSTLAHTKKYDAIITLGTIIRGETPHFEFIASECSSGLSYISRSSAVPITFGILTTENIEQAIERAGTKVGNKGAEAAISALEMLNVLQSINLIS